MSMPRESRIRVLCVDDHPLLREGIASVLEELEDIELVGAPITGPKPSRHSHVCSRTLH